MDKVTLEELALFQRKHRLHAPIVLSALGQHHDFMAAIETEVGQELLKDLIRVMEENAQKIADETSTEPERAEYRVARKLAALWSERINLYNEKIGMIKKVTENGGDHGKRKGL